MPSTKRGQLRVHAFGGVRVTDVRGFLGVFEEAYNAVAYFESSIDGAQRAARDMGPGPFWPFFPVGVGLRGRIRVGPASWPPGAAEIASYITTRERLILHAVRLESPGFWDFIGKLNPLEVIRQYLVDRHERRKDREYKEPAEKRRLELENKLLENKVVKERIEIARQLGATDHDLAPLINELVLRPAERLDAYQDGGVIEVAEFVEDPEKDRR